MARLVSKVYGDALYNFAKENDQIEKMYEEALDIVEVFAISKELQECVYSPNVSVEQKIGLMKNIFCDKLWTGPAAKIFKFFHINISKGNDTKIIEFLELVLKKGRQKNIVPILKYFAHLVLVSKNIGEAYVVSAHKLNDTQKKQLEKKVVETTKFDKFNINYGVDENLIAGISIKIGDKVFDNTYKTKLGDISKNLRGLNI